MRSFKKPGKVHSGPQRNGFSKRAAYQFLEIFQVAFLELLQDIQDITKVYSSCGEEKTNQFFVLFLGRLVGVADNMGPCHLLVGLS